MNRPALYLSNGNCAGIIAVHGNGRIVPSSPTGQTIMHNRIFILMLGGALAACGTPADRPADRSTGAASRVEKVDTTRDATSTAGTLDGYKRDLAQRITQVNSTKVFAGRPQALLRSVVVLKYSVDAQGNLVHSEIQRSNRDSVTEATALATLRNAAPFPKP